MEIVCQTKKIQLDNMQMFKCKQISTYTLTKRADCHGLSTATNGFFFAKFADNLNARIFRFFSFLIKVTTGNVTFFEYRAFFEIKNKHSRTNSFRLMAFE